MRAIYAPVGFHLYYCPSGFTWRSYPVFNVTVHIAMIHLNRESDDTDMKTGRR